jgi:hypothetical protein
LSRGIAGITGVGLRRAVGAAGLRERIRDAEARLNSLLARRLF